MIGWGEIMGDTERLEDYRESDGTRVLSPWLKLDNDILKASWAHENGHTMRIECVAVDSGFRPDTVYRFCKMRAGRKVFAVKGSKEIGKPLVGRPTSNNAYRARLYMLCTDSGKETVMNRLNIAKKGPGYMHLPDWVPREYVDQLTAQKFVYVGGKGRRSIREWSSTRANDHAFDLERYTLAAIRILLGPQPRRAIQLRLTKLALKRDPTPGEPSPPPAVSPSPAPDPSPLPPAVQRRTLPTRPRRGWVQGWRR